MSPLPINQTPINTPGLNPVAPSTENNVPASAEGKTPDGKSVQKSAPSSSVAAQVRKLNTPSLSNQAGQLPQTTLPSERIIHLGTMLRPMIQAQTAQQAASETRDSHTELLKGAQRKYNEHSQVGKMGLKLQAFWKNNAYAQKIDYQEKLTQDIKSHPLPKPMGAETFRAENQAIIKGWLEGVEQCSPRRQPDMIKLILSKAIQTGNPTDVTPIKNWLHQHESVKAKVDSYYYSTHDEQLKHIENLTQKLKSTTSGSEKSKLQKEFAEKLKGTVVKDEKTLNTLARFIGACPLKARPALLKAMHDQLQNCGSDSKLTTAMEHLSNALRSSPR
ncbi:MAG: hypothetical protein LBJ78_03630 [Puniceicoccales bacterium]|jgi:hypothetical protein|nr:hypothetical protein [Puniceicoccales bacterium]